MLVEAVVVDQPRRGAEAVPAPDGAEVEEVVLGRQRGDPEAALPEQLAQRRLILPHAGRAHRLGPATEEAEHLRRAAIGDDPAVELREGRRQRPAPDGVGRRAVAGLVVGERDVEAVENLEDVAQVGDGQHVGVEVQRALEAGRRHRVDAGAEPGSSSRVTVAKSPGSTGSSVARSIGSPGETRATDAAARAASCR